MNESQAALGEDCGVKETLYHAYKGFNTLFNIGGKSRESALLWGRATTYLKVDKLGLTNACVGLALILAADTYLRKGGGRG